MSCWWATKHFDFETSLKIDNAFTRHNDFETSLKIDNAFHMTSIYIGINLYRIWKVLRGLLCVICQDSGYSHKNIIKGKFFLTQQSQNNIFFRKRLISGGLEPVLSQTEKLFKAPYYKRIWKCTIIRLKPVFLAPR